MAARHRITVKVLLLLACLSLPAIAQVLHDAPDPKPEPVYAEAHRFFDLHNNLASTASFGLRLADTIQTCRELNLPRTYPNTIIQLGGGNSVNLNGLPRGYREAFFPVDSCAGLAAWQTGTLAVAFGGSYLLHNTGHHKLERLPQWMSTVGAAAGMIYTSLHRHDPRVCNFLQSHNLPCH